jgi:transposase InsO family protein
LCGQNSFDIQESVSYTFSHKKEIHIKYQKKSNQKFWGTLKNELVYHTRYATREQAIREITEYIEIFYKRQRRQARLGYLSPAAYGQQFYRERFAA